MTAPRRPLRIVLALETSGPGGAENMVLQFCSALHAKGHGVRLATMREGWMTERAEAAGLETWILPQKQGLDLGWAGTFARRLCSERIDVLHTHEFAMNVFGGAASRLARVAAVSTIHGKNWIVERRRRVIAYRVLRRLGIPIVAVSNDLARFLVEKIGMSAGGIRMIHNGISVEGGLPSLDERAKARREIGLPGAGPLCLAVGNLYAVKDHATLLRAAARISDLRVAIAGRGEEESNLARLSAELGIDERVHLLGLREDVGTLLASADLFVQPSQSEGLPLAVLEAMAAGLPIVASRVGGIPEAIEDGRSGLLFPAGDDLALEKHLRRLLSDGTKLRAMGRAARERASSEFSIAAMTSQYEALYTALLR